MRQKIGIIKLNKYTVGFSIFAAIVALSAVIIFQRNQTEAATAVKPIPMSNHSQFSFTGAAEWWQGATNKTSMALFHKVNGCFTSVEHKTGTVDVASELKITQDKLISDGYTVTPLSAQMLTLQTALGQQKYELHQSNVTGTGNAGKLKGGQEFGYVQLSNSYLKIMGYCDTADQLPSTIPALAAIKFDSSIK